MCFIASAIVERKVTSRDIARERFSKYYPNEFIGFFTLSLARLFVNF